MQNKTLSKILLDIKFPPYIVTIILTFLYSYSILLNNIQYVLSIYSIPLLPLTKCTYFTLPYITLLKKHIFLLKCHLYKKYSLNKKFCPTSYQLSKFIHFKSVMLLLYFMIIPSQKIYYRANFYILVSLIKLQYINNYNISPNKKALTVFIVFSVVPYSTKRTYFIFPQIIRIILYSFCGGDVEYTA